MMFTGEVLQQALGVLREAGGYFVFRDETGREFVLTRKEDFGGVGTTARLERQLELAPIREGFAGLATAVRETAERMDTTPAFVLDSINREIARYTEEEREREIDDLSVSFEAGHDRHGPPLPPARFGKKVRFEPITGDLPPELQE